MNKNMRLSIADFYTFSGRIGRLKFISGISIILMLSTIYYFAGLYFKLFSLASEKGHILIALPTLFFIIAVIPLFIRRLHDLNTHGGWVATFIVCLAFLNTNIWAAIYAGLGLMILLLKKGNPDENEWGVPNNAN